MDDSSNPLEKTLLDAPVRGHVVEFYDDATRLVRQVADFAEVGLRGQEAVVVIAVPNHLELFRYTFQERGLRVQALENAGRLTWMSAEPALGNFVMDGQLYWTRFESTIGATISHASKRFGKLRVYGEMVNVLWQKGLADSALELEDFWNRLSVLHPFCLFCAYALDQLDPDLNAKAISSICRTHSHAFVHAGDRSLEEAIQHLIDDVA